MVLQTLVWCWLIVVIDWTTVRNADIVVPLANEFPEIANDGPTNYSTCGVFFLNKESICCVRVDK